MSNSNKRKNDALNEYELMGFNRALASQVWDETNGDESRMLELLIQYT